MTTNNDFTTTNVNGTIGTGTACNYTNTCGYKLPCGLCRLLMSQCPKEYSYPNITCTASDRTITNPCDGGTTIAEMAEKLGNIGRSVGNEVQP